MSGEYLFVGDSRGVGIAATQGVAHGARLASSNGKNDAAGQGKDGNYYYTSGGQDIGWFKNNAATIAKKAKDQDSDYIVVAMGANDWPKCTTQAAANKAAQQYIDVAKRIEKESGKKVVFVSPYPMNGAYETNQYNKNIPHERDDCNRYLGYFNNALENATKQAGMGYIDGFTYGQQYIGKKGYWMDGVHGSATLSKDFRNFVQTEVEKISANVRQETKDNMHATATAAQARARAKQKEAASTEKPVQTKPRSATRAKPRSATSSRSSR